MNLRVTVCAYCAVTMLLGMGHAPVDAASAVAVTKTGHMVYVWGEQTIEEAIKKAIHLALLGGKKQDSKETTQIIMANNNGGYGAVAGWAGASGAFAFGASSNGLFRSMAEKNAIESCVESGGQKPVIIKVWFDFVGVPQDMIPDSERGTSRDPGSGILDAEYLRR